MTVSNQVAELKSKRGELHSAWKALNDENSTIVATAGMVEVKDGNKTVPALDINNERATAFRKNIAQMKDLRSNIDMLDEQIKNYEWGSQPDHEPFGFGAQPLPSTDAKSIGQLFTESEEFKALAASKTGNMPQPWHYEGKDMGSKWETKDVYSAAPAGGPPLGFRPLYREPVVVQAFRKARVRDLFPVQTTTAAVIEYFRVLGFAPLAGLYSGTNAASTTPERLADNSNFALAPHTNLDFQGVQSPVRMINHWEAAHRNVLADVPQLQGIIDTELLYGLRLAEDNQILNGTGTGEDLTGLMSGAIQGIQTYSRSSSPASTTDTKVDDIRRAATKAILAYYEPTGIVLHPNDWATIETYKDSTGAYIIAIAVSMGAEQRLWRLPVVDTPAMTQGSALVGSFGLGAKLYDRQEGTIRVAEQHADFFLRSAVVVLAEERLALTVPRPESFVNVTLGTP